jgi:phosphate/phosphite/phosphonate ABC transporter binding protein
MMLGHGCGRVAAPPAIGTSKPSATRLLGFFLLASWAVACAPDAEYEIPVRLETGGRVLTREPEAAPGPTSEEGPLRFAYASVLSPERSTLTYAHLASYLAARIGRDVEIVRRRTYAELNELLRNGNALAGIVCTGAYAIGHDQWGLQAMALPEVEGQLTYRSYLITRREPGIQTLEDLQGRVFAFSDPLSNSGFRYVAAELLRRGTSPDEFFSRFFFTYSHDNTIEAVRDGIADAGSIDSLVWDYLVRTDPRITSDLRVIGRSEEFPINPVVVSPHASPELTRTLTNVFLTMAEDPEGAELLEELGVSRFVPPTSSSALGYEAIARSWRDLGVINPPDLEEQG